VSLIWRACRYGKQIFGRWTKGRTFDSLVFIMTLCVWLAHAATLVAYSSPTQRGASIPMYRRTYPTILATIRMSVRTGCLYAHARAKAVTRRVHRRGLEMDCYLSETTDRSLGSGASLIVCRQTVPLPRTIRFAQWLTVSARFSAPGNIPIRTRYRSRKTAAFYSCRLVIRTG